MALIFIKIYLIEWKLAEKEGRFDDAKKFKEKHTELVKKSLEIPYRQYILKLKEYPTIYLN